jgi:hypothetical protein
MHQCHKPLSFNQTLGSTAPHYLADNNYMVVPYLPNLQ